MDPLGTYLWIRALEKKDPPTLDGIVVVVALFLLAVLINNLTPLPEPKEIIQQIPSPGPVFSPRKTYYDTTDTQRGKRRLLMVERIPPRLPAGY